MRIHKDIQSGINQFYEICHSHKINYLFAFGSSVGNTFDENTSDIDFIVDIIEQDPIKKGELLFSLWDSFENFFHRKVDLLTPLLNTESCLAIKY